MNKSIEVIWVIGLMLFGSAYAGVTISNEHFDNTSAPINNQTYEFEKPVDASFTFSTPVINLDDNYATVTIPEATSYLNEIGAPRLPVFTHTLFFPVGTAIKHIECNPITIETNTLPTKIRSASSPIPLDGRDYTIITSEDTNIYTVNNLYPESWFKYSIGVGLYNDRHVIMLNIEMYPVRYNPVADIIEYAETMNLSVSTEITEDPLLIGDAYDLLVIAPQKFSEELQPLLEHKEAHGMRTMFAATEGIYGNFEGRDEAEQIKYYIKDAIEQFGIKYVLLVGGMKMQFFWAWYVPVRYSHLDDNSSWEASYVSDLYFADIYKYDNGQIVFDDWDSNGNGIFAEWTRFNKDILDLYPDVYVGRLPCRNEQEVTVVVNKIIAYETQTSGQDWFNRMVVIGGDSFEDSIPGIETDYIEGQLECDQALSYMDSFDKVRLYVEGGDYDFTPENAIAVLSEGEGFVYFSGHGNPTSWATHPHNNFEIWIDFNLESIQSLTNGNKLPVLVVGGCHNSQFNVSRLNALKIWEGYSRWLSYFWKGETSPVCWSWLITRLEDGGAIAAIGNTGLGFGSVGDGPVDEVPDSVPDGIPDVVQYLGGWMEPHFFEVYNQQGKHMLGETWGTTISDYINQFPIDWQKSWQGERPYTIEQIDLKTIQEWTLFGDPSLKIGGYP